MNEGTMIIAVATLTVVGAVDPIWLVLVPAVLLLLGWLILWARRGKRFWANEPLQVCPECASKVPAGTRHCIYCHADLPQGNEND